MLLSALSHPVSNLKNCGPKRAALLKKLGIFTVKDLLLFFPRAYSDRTALVSLREAAQNGSGTVRVKVIDHRLIGNRYKKFLKVIVQDTTGTFGALLCFHRNFLKNKLKQGDSFFITGKFSKNYNEIQSSSFEIEPIGENEEFTGKIMPVYPLTEGLNQNILRRLLQDTIKDYIPRLEEELPEWCIKHYRLYGGAKAIQAIHFPLSSNDYLEARRRLIFEEFFFQKLFLIDRKNQSRQTKNKRPEIAHNYQKAVIEHLPFSLMDYQKAALEELRKNMFSENVFSILLQGDVGSGKTLVALLAMLDAVECGYQAVLLVPTEVLATQHYRTIRNYTRDLWLDTALLTGNMSKKERDNILSGLKSGEIKIAVGTHALFSADVEYRNLGFAVIDEQHRFGVEQRYQLLSKGTGVDLLLMTATPIPQSLAQSLYGDLDLVTMRGKITGRLPVRTWVVEDNQERITSMHAWIKKTLAEDDGRAIFVYPLIEDTGKSDVKNLQDESEKLAGIYKDEGCISIHSGTPAPEKDQIIQDFRSGKIKVLAATTVVEVGLDVPDANIIVVENADHFGLSTLHQLRGRVGRNSKQGYMILIPGERVTEQGMQRLGILRNEHDGFRIAEQDLQMRGPGDFIGNRQSGMFNIRLADIKHDMQLLLDSGKAAEHLAKEDPAMEQTQHIITRESFHLRIKNYIDNITT